MFGQGLPSYVLAVRREGQPLSLANAFEKPVEAKRGSGFVEPSIAALEEEWIVMENTFGVKAEVLCKLDPKKIGKNGKIADTPLDKLIESLVAGIA